MTKIISIHEYTLKPTVTEDQFKNAIREAQERHLLQLPGLEGVHFLRGIKGKRRGSFAAIWIYESREVWERIWGSPEEPHSKDDYPNRWRVWEEEILAPIHDGDLDQIEYTAYEVI
jgi:hypothetical protein